MSPKVDSSERREEILEAAHRCFSRSGYAGTSMDDIVRESGLSKGTLYWHFENKHDLFMALFDHILSGMVGQLDEVWDPSLSPTEQLRTIGEGIILAFDSGQELTTMPVKFLTEIWQEPAFMERYLNMLIPFGEMFTEVIARGVESGEFREVDPKDAAWGLMALFDGLFLYAMTDLPIDLKRQSVLMTDIIINGLLKRES